MSSPNNRTAAQVTEANIIAMGQQLGEVYSALWQQLNWIHQKWGQFVELFGTNPETIELLNRTGPHFFRTVQDALWADVLLHITRITDPPRSAGKENLSLRRLPQLLDNKNLRATVEDLLAVVVNETEFARDWRNRRIAHGDLLLALDSSVEPLATASRAHVRTALVGMDHVLNAVSQHYVQSTTMFDFAEHASAGGGTSMLHYLRAGQQVEELNRQRKQSGKLSPDENEQRPI